MSKELLIPTERLVRLYPETPEGAIGMLDDANIAFNGMFRYLGPPAITHQAEGAAFLQAFGYDATSENYHAAYQQLRDAGYEDNAAIYAGFCRVYDGHDTVELEGPSNFDYDRFAQRGCRELEIAAIQTLTNEGVDYEGVYKPRILNSPNPFVLPAKAVDLTKNVTEPIPGEILALDDLKAEKQHRIWPEFLREALIQLQIPENQLALVPGTISRLAVIRSKLELEFIHESVAYRQKKMDKLRQRAAQASGSIE